jgi:hypothetical protein
LLVAVSMVTLITLTALLVSRREGAGPVDSNSGKRPEHIRQELFDLLQPVTLADCSFERFGEPHDGGYLMCGNLLNAVEAGYSYGISGYDQWGCDVATKLQVPLHQYDCFDLRQPACPHGETFFHAECVGPLLKLEKGRVFDTVHNQIAKNGDTRKRLVVKMDVEGAEWDSLLATPDEMWDQIDQLAIELHGVNEERFLTVVQRLKEFFYLAHLHFNNYSCTDDAAPLPASVYEVLFVSKRIAALAAVQTDSGPHPLAAPNSPELPDCQLPMPSG